MKTAISLPDDLFHDAERAAQSMGLSRSELYQRALRAFLDRHSNQAVTEALNLIYAGEDAGAGLDPVLARLQKASLTSEW
jgi:metal-responsive CopG/Arc/MetJ family transcriptional regulator